MNGGDKAAAVTVCVCGSLGDLGGWESVYYARRIDDDAMMEA